MLWATRRPRGGWPRHGGGRSGPGLLREELSPLFQGVAPSLWSQNWNRTQLSRCCGRSSPSAAVWPSRCHGHSEQSRAPGMPRPPLRLPAGDQQAFTSPSGSGRWAQVAGTGAPCEGPPCRVRQNGPAGPSGAPPSASPSSAFPPPGARDPKSVSQTAAPQLPPRLCGDWAGH